MQVLEIYLHWHESPSYLHFHTHRGWLKEYAEQNEHEFYVSILEDKGREEIQIQINTIGFASELNWFTSLWYRNFSIIKAFVCLHFDAIITPHYSMMTVILTVSNQGNFFWHLTLIPTPFRVYLIDTRYEGRARDSRPPQPHPPVNLFLTGGPDESR